MGFSCHVASKYEVKYGYTCFSGSDQEYVNTTLHTLCPGMWHSGEYAGTSEDLEIPKDELEEAIVEIENNKKKYNKEIKDEGYNLTANTMIENFKSLLENSDPKNDFVRLAWY